MKVLVVGGGGREHALAWAIKKSPRLERLYVAPGNGGTAAVAENLAVGAEDVDALLDFVVRNGIDLTVVGPEAPLVAGIVDQFSAEGMRCFGPSRDAARLEGSKVFAKQFMKKHGIPTADFAVFDDPDSAKARIAEVGAPVVIKADGLAAGKGVIVAESVDTANAAVDEIMIERKFGESGRQVIVEACLQGEEVSVHSICGGGRAVLFPSSQDHKRIFDGDRGPNTGGMGAYAPVPSFDDGLRDEVYETVVMPTLQGMAADGSPFAGVLYAGLMMTADGPKVLEYNVRFGDPETQVLLPLLRSDLLDVLYDSAGATLPEQVSFHEDRFAATVVVAAQGYPGSYEKGKQIVGVDRVDGDNRVAFHAGTRQTPEGLVTSGGRVLAVTAWGGDLSKALGAAYEGVGLVQFDGAQFRKDIGRRAL